MLHYFLSAQKRDEWVQEMPSTGKVNIYMQPEIKPLINLNTALAVNIKYLLENKMDRKEVKDVSANESSSTFK